MTTLERLREVAVMPDRDEHGDVKYTVIRLFDARALLALVEACQKWDDTLNAAAEYASRDDAENTTWLLMVEDNDDAERAMVEAFRAITTPPPVAADDPPTEAH